MSDDSADLEVIVALAIAPLAARIDQLFAEQHEHAGLLAQMSARLDELAQQVTDLRGQAIWFEHRAEGAESHARNARSIVMQAEHHMQQQLASVNERLLDVTADVHRLHAIRESPEHELYRLHSELAVLQHRLTQIEGAEASQ
jgi:chromosome segregation ATPase